MEWTGFADKTLWDWLQLFATLAIPLVLGIATFRFNSVQARLAKQQRDTDQKTAHDQQQETALQSYLDHMSDLLLGNNTGRDSPSLGLAQSNDEISQVAHAQTLTVLRNLDEKHKGIVLQFLHDAKLIGCTGKATAIIDLHGTDLHGIDLSSANLSGANLSSTNLSGAILSNANLSGATLSNTNLSSANLSSATLSNANLKEANLNNATFNGGADLSSASLSGAILSEGQLMGAILQNADLSGTDLWHTNLHQANLGKAKLDGADLGKADLSDTTYLVGASYTRRTNWPAGFDHGKAGTIKIDVRRLPAFVDFSSSPLHYYLANATLKTKDLQFAQSHVKLDINQQVVIEFDLTEDDLAKTIVTVKGLIAQNGPNNAGDSPISLQLNSQPAFQSDYTMPGGGYRPISRSFPAPPEQLTSGSNTLTLTVSPKAQTFFWLYRLEVGLKSPSFQLDHRGLEIRR